MNQDERIVCRECGVEFIFTSSEQMFYAERGFLNRPRRCAECRVSARALNEIVRPRREQFTAVCADCGMETQLPFQPRGDKPVYCKACFATRRMIDN